MRNGFIRLRKLWLRGIVLAPPSLLLASGVLQLAQAPREWTRGADANALPGWTIGLDVIILATPFVLCGLWGTIKVWQNTRHKFSLNVMQLPIGLFGVLPTLFVLFLLREDVDTGFSYEAVVGSGKGAALSLFFTTGIALIWGGCTGAFLTIYVSGIVDEGSGKYDKRPDETDGVAQLIEQMKVRGA